MINKDQIKNNLYEAVNGEWIKNAVIPEDRSSVGGFSSLAIETEEFLTNHFLNLKEEDVEDKSMKEFIKFFNKTKDMELRNAENVEGLKIVLKKLDELKSYKDLETKAKELELLNFGFAYSQGASPDMMNATKHALYLSVPNIILPDKTYYEDTHPKKEALLTKYKEVLEKVLDKVGYSKDEINKLVADTFAFDSLIYPHVKTSEELADYTKEYNPRSIEEVDKYSKQFSFKKIFENIFGTSPETIIVTQPDFFAKYDEIVTDNNFEIFKSWVTTNYIMSNTSSLTDEIRILGGEYGRFLQGVEKAKSIEKYAYDKATSMFSGVVSIYYGQKFFGEESKKDVRNMVESMIEVYKKRLAENDWLDEKTSKNAIEKLEAFEILVGYPDNYEEYYKKFIYDETITYFENVINFTKIIIEHQIEQLNKPVNRTEWHMPSNMVNAYYSPTGNLICFPAAILQAPFYSIKQTKSENYGGIGAVIGHEISHAFDNNGAKFDKNGNLNNWWTEEDFKKFDEKAKAMIDLFDGIPFGNSHVNGTLTVSENIADAGGLSCSLEALAGTGEANYEEFFINHAKIWCRKVKPELVDLLLSIDVHAPAELRTNIQPRNLKEFYETFNVVEGDGMYLAPEKRVNIW